MKREWFRNRYELCEAVFGYLSANCSAQPLLRSRGCSVRPSPYCVSYFSEECFAVMHACATQNYPHTRNTSIDLSYHLRFLVSDTANHEDNNVLRLVPRVALQEGILDLF